MSGPPEDPVPTARPTTTGRTPPRVVAGVDGSPASLAAAWWACEQAARIHAGLELITTWEWTTGYGWSVVPPEWDPPGDSRRHLEELATSLGAAHPDVPVTITVIEGAAGPILVAAAIDADLLVVGTRGRGELRGMVLGSVSLHCVTHAPCPVVVVPPPGGGRHRGGDRRDDRGGDRAG